MSIIDFAENYTFLDFNETQEMHWHLFQLTILVHICYRWNIDYIQNPNFFAKKLVIEYRYYISDDLEHDTLFVQHCDFKLHWAQLIERGFYYNEHLVWLDGCVI